VITALQLKSATAKAASPQITALGGAVTLYSPSAAAADLPLKPSAIKISRGASSYSTLIIPANSEVLAAVLAMPEDTRIRLQVTLISPAGKTYSAVLIDLDLTDFRADMGVQSSTVTLVSTTPINIPKAAAITLTKYAQKQKSTDPITYSYAIEPLDFVKYSIGTVVTEGAVTGAVSRYSLEIGRTTALNIEVTP